MLFLLRKIRKALLSKNRFTTYLLYAIGEIVLVVIGILIALQVNNWNEERKNNKEEQQILRLLYQDVVLAKAQSEETLSNEVGDIEKLLLVLGSEKDRLKLNDEPNLDKYLYEVFWSVSHEIPRVIAYQELQNTGKTGMIRNATLRSKFSTMELRIDLLESMLNDRLAVHQQRIDKIAENEINFLPILAAYRNLKNIDLGVQNDYFEILKRTDIRNLLAIKLELSYEVLKIRKGLDKELSELLDLLNNQLK